MIIKKCKIRCRICFIWR